MRLLYSQYYYRIEGDLYYVRFLNTLWKLRQKVDLKLVIQKAFMSEVKVKWSSEGWTEF